MLRRFCRRFRLCGEIELIAFLIRLEPKRGIFAGISVGFFIAGLIRSPIDPLQSIWLQAFAAASMLFSLIRLRQSIVASKPIEITPDRLFTRSLGAARPSAQEGADGFRILHDARVSGTILMSESFNRFLRQPSNDLTITRDEKGRRRLLKTLQRRADVLAPILCSKWVREQKQGNQFFNDPKVGVFSPIRSNVGTLSLGKVDYFSAFLTNELTTASVTIRRNGEHVPFYDGTKEFPWSEGASRRLYGLESYDAANHLGVSTLGLTKDHFIVFWWQRSNSQVSQRLRAPTGSGSLDWQDLQRGTVSARKLLLTGLEREFHEESNRRGVRAQRQIEESMLLGYFRNLNRGGKPDFVALSRLSVNHVELGPNDDEVEERSRFDRQLVESLEDLDALCARLLDDDDSARTLSIPLWANLLALRQAIRDDPQMIREFLQLSA